MNANVSRLRNVACNHVSLIGTMLIWLCFLAFVVRCYSIIMRYSIKFRTKTKHAKSYQSGEARFSRLDKLTDFIERTRKKYEYCEFEKYDNGELVSTFS